MDQQSGALPWVDLSIVLGFLAVVIAVGGYFSRRASSGLEDYFLGGKKIPWWVLGVSTASSNFDMAGTMIIVAMVATLGYRGFLVEIRGGVGLSLAFLLIFLGKWLRRSRVMTSAEWMKLRFGTDRAGKAAHLLSAIANITLSLGMIIYFCKGAGKFMTNFVPVNETACTSVMVGVGLFYTLMSGLYGVVFTDLIQMILLGLTAIYISAYAWSIAPDVSLDPEMLRFTLSNPTTLAEPLLQQDPATWGPIISSFGLCVAFWTLRTTLEGGGGVGGYTDQRFFAAKNEREAGLLTLESIVLSGLRWTMVAGLVVLGRHLMMEGGAAADMIAADPEQTLPVVLSELLPVGIRGLVLAGLIAAAMSTFDSTLNAGASYIVRDLYQSYWAPKATQARLLTVSRLATVGLCVAGVVLAALVPNINQIWALITMGLGAGLFVPLFLRWYWPRFNGWGFAAGTAMGMTAGLTFQGVMAWPLYYAFPSVIGSALMASLIATLVTKPVDGIQLARFAAQINPFGPWSNHEALAVSSGLLGAEEVSERRSERRRDALAVVCALPFQVSLLMAGMSLIFRDTPTLVVSSSILAVSSVGLYALWYRGLKAESKCEDEDKRFDAA